MVRALRMCGIGRMSAWAPIALAAAVSGCGSSSGSGASSSAPVQVPAGPLPGAGAVQVKLVNIAFSPVTVRVRVGQRVTWTNADSVDHNVIGVGGRGGPHSGLLHSGDTYSFVPRSVGRVRYVCTLHPQMHATLEVWR